MKRRLSLKRKTLSLRSLVVGEYAISKKSSFVDNMASVVGSCNAGNDFGVILPSILLLLLLAGTFVYYTTQ